MARGVFGTSNSLTWCVLLLGAFSAVPTSWSLSINNEQAVTSRRTFARQLLTLPAAVVAVGAGTAAPTAATAYERRDVGGEGRSAETAAYNIQAMETNARLEREGFKLETQAEQQASLTAALADYAYSPTNTAKSGNTKAENKNKQAASKATKK